MAYIWLALFVECLTLALLSVLVAGSSGTSLPSTFDSFDDSIHFEISWPGNVLGDSVNSDVAQSEVGMSRQFHSVVSTVYLV